MKFSLLWEQLSDQTKIVTPLPLTSLTRLTQLNFPKRFQYLRLNIKCL